MHRLLLLAPVLVGSAISFREGFFQLTNFLILFIITLAMNLAFEFIEKKAPHFKNTIIILSSFLLILLAPLAYYIQSQHLPMHILIAALIFLIFSIGRHVTLKIQQSHKNKVHLEKYFLVFGYSLMLPFILIFIAQLLKIFPTLTAMVMFSYFFDSRILRDVRNINNSSFLQRTDRFIFIFGACLAVGWLQL